MKKKKVGVLCPQVPFVRGGAELMTENLVRQLNLRGFDADLITMPYKWYPEKSLYDSMLLWRMTELSENNVEKIDLLIPTKFPAYGVRHHNKVAWVIHQFRQVYDLYENIYGYKNLPEGERIRQNVMKYDNMTLTECQEIYAISKIVEDRLWKYNGIESKTLYHPPALSGRYFHETYGNYMLLVGRLDRLKRNDLLIQAMKYCDKEIKVKIAGRGPDMERLQKVAHKCGVSDRIEFLGFVPDEDLLKLYANAFAVFFAPTDEDYGYITLEAFLSKKPIITAWDSGGSLEFVEDEINGYICSANPEEFGERINRLYNHKKQCEDFGINGYNVVKDISWDPVIDMLTISIR